MTIIQGGPKPVVAVPVEHVSATEPHDVAATAIVRSIAKTESTSHYAREGHRDANVDDVRGRKVDTRA